MSPLATYSRRGPVFEYDEALCLMSVVSQIRATGTVCHRVMLSIVPDFGVSDMVDITCVDVKCGALR